MPRATLLTAEEKAVILAHDETGMNVTEIARCVQRHHSTVGRFLRQPNRSQPASRRPTNKKLSCRDVRHIVQTALRYKKSAKDIRDHLNLSISVRRVQQILCSTAFLKYSKARSAPYLKIRHKEARLEWAKEKLQWNQTIWKDVMFTDEKKLNLDGPDGLQYHWHDLRKEPEIFSKRQQGGGSVMVWGAISYKGTLELEGIDGNMDSEYYCEVLRVGLLPVADDVLGDNWILVQDGASVHTSNHTADWLDANDVSVIDWPAKSPDLNIIENVWGILARKVYKDGRQFETIHELQDAIHIAWSQIDRKYIKTLYKSLPRRLIAVIEKKGAQTKY